jgi:hypothetical protein
MPRNDKESQRRHDKLWRAGIRRKIREGMASIRAGRTIPAADVKAEMIAFKETALNRHPGEIF